MKKLFYFLIVGLMFTACSNNIEEKTMTTSCTSSHATISCNEALEIADYILNKGTKAGICLNKDVCYVLNNGRTRNDNFLPDTLAYIINYDHNEGFAVVSAVGIPNPVLAFSQEGSFSIENEIASENFVNSLDEYLTDMSLVGGTSPDLTLKPCVFVEPMLRINLHQRSPWNLKLTGEAEGCPVGCGAVAAALAMTHCKPSLDYHETTFSFSNILDAIETYQTTGLNSIEIDSDSNSDDTSVYTYTDAVDSMGDLLAYLGEDLNMEYSQSSSSCDASKIPKTLLNAGYNIPSGYVSYDLDEIHTYLQARHLICIYGRADGAKSGHSWIVDGCAYMLGDDGLMDLSNLYLHCNWGWGGSCNGYYCGEIFAPTSSSEYRLRTYFAVEIE